MAFLYLGTSQASNEFTPSSRDVGKSLHHWVSPSVGSSAYAKFKPFSSSPIDIASDDVTDSIVRVRIEAVRAACPGQVITLTAIIENDYVGINDVRFRRNGQYLPAGGYDPNLVNSPRVVYYDTIPEREGLDSLILDYDVIIAKTGMSCHTYMSPKHYVRVNSIHVLLDSVYVCNDTDAGMMCANVYSNGAEYPYAYVWYRADNSVVDTTFVPCKSLTPGSYYVEPHFNWGACVKQSNVAAVVVTNGPADDHITMNDITALACNGNQVFAQLTGMVDTMGTPSYAWSLNGVAIPGANDSTLVFSPLAIAGDTTMYILKAEVTYSNYNCKTYVVTDTIKVLDDPTIAIYGDPVVCGSVTFTDSLVAHTNGLITDPHYTWTIDGVAQTVDNATLKLADVSTSLTARNYPYEITVSVVGGNACSATSNSFLLYVGTAPTVHINKSADTVCNGTSVTLTATLADNNATNLTYEWYKKVGTAAYELVNTATTAQYTTTVTDSTSFAVTVKQTDSECSSTDTVTVYVYPDTLSVKNLLLTVTDTAVCYGGQVTVTLVDTANTKQYGETGTYQWTLNGVTIPVYGKNYTFSPATVDNDSTIYNIGVAATYTTQCGVVTAPGIDTSIVVFRNPSVVIAGDPIVCNSDTVRLTAIVNGAPATGNYTWRVDGVDSIQNKDFKAQLSERDYAYNITVVMNPGTACELESSVYPVIIGNDPTVAIGVSASTVCKNQEVTLTAHLGDYNMPNLTYQWYSKKANTTGDSTAIAIGTSAVLTIPVADTTQYTVVVSQVNSGCFAKGDTIINIYSETPEVKPVLVQADQYNVCYGAQVTFTAIDTANYKVLGTGTYQWSVNGVAVNGATDSIYTFAPATVDNDSINYTVSVRVDYATACAGLFAENDTMITVYRNPSVVIAGDPIVCDGSAMNLTAVVHDTLAGATISYLWRVDGVDSTTAETFTATLEQRDYPYELTVVLNANTACEVVSNPFTVLIGSNPTAALEVSDTIVCAGSDVTLTAHLGDYNMPNLTYLWYKKTTANFDSIPVGTSRILTIPVGEETQYFVKITQVNSECVAYSDTVTVKVYENAAAVKPMVLLASDTAVCYGGQISYAVIDTANIKLFGNGTYQWSVNGVDVAGATDSIYVFSPATVDNNLTTYNVAVNVTYVTPCELITASVDTMVSVQRNPSVVIVGDPIVCDGSAMNLTAVVHDTLPGATISYLWRVDGVDSTTAETFTATLEQRDYPYELTVVLNAGTACEVVSDPFTVLIGSNPTAALEASDTILCKGESVTLTAHLGDYNMPNLVYSWYKKTTANFDSIPIGTSRILTIPVDEETQYFVKITQVNSECVAYSDTLTIKVYEDAAAVKPLILLASDTAICFGGQVSYAVVDSANIKLYGVKGTYQWSVNGVDVAGATDSIYVFSPEAVDNDSTAYIVAVEVTYVTPCEVVTAAIDTVVSVQRNPSVVISGDPILCQDSLVSLYATVHDTLAGHAVTYLWRVDGVDSVNQNTNHFEGVLPVRDYPYEVTVVINAGTACEAVSEVYSVLIGINPTVAIEVSAPIVCNGDEVTLTAHLGDYNMPNLVYQWYYGKPDYSDTNAIAIGTSRVLTIPVTDTTRYYVRVKQVNSECEAWADTVVNVYPQDPEVKPIEILASDSSVCIGGQIAFAVQDTANRNQYFGSDTIPGAYRWFVNGFELMTVSGDHFMFSPAAFDFDTTNYVVEVMASYQTECNIHTTTAADTVTARNNPSVVINGDPMICDTTLVHLEAIVNDTLPGINVTYLWRVDGADSTSMTTNIFETNLPARDYPYEITVVLNQGSNCEVVSEPFYLYIEDQPEVVVTVDYDTVCQGQVVTLTAHLGNYNQGNLTYQWFADDDTIYYGTESTVAYTITKPAGQTTHFKVIVTQLNSACQGTGFDSVYTFKNPILDTILVTNLQDDIYDAYSYHQYYQQPAYDVCEGASVEITAYLIDTATNQRYIDSTISYKWRRNGVIIEGVNEYRFMEQLSILDHDQYKYVYTVEIDEPYYPNCYSIPTQVHSDTVKVRRNPVVIIGGEQFVCDRGTSENNVLLNAWVDGAIDTGAIYRWYRDGMFEENPYHAQYGAMFLGSFRARYGYNYTFQVEVINGSGCSSWSEPFEVTVMAPPVINITPYADTVCTGGEVILVSHLDDYNVVDYELQYQWYTNSVTDDNAIPGATEAVYRTNVDQTTSYLVKVGYLVENSNMPACVAVDTTVVTVYDRPEIDSIIMSLTEICEGAQVQLTAVMDSVHQGVPNVPYIYEWYRNSELMPGNAATIYDSPMTADGNEQQFTYSVKVYQNPDRLMCESPIFVSSQTLTVFPNPIVAIFGDQHVCYTDTITLVANIDTISNPVSTNVHYYWFESGAPIDNLNGDSAVLSYYAPAQDEPYRFTVQVERDSSVTGCRSYSYEYDVWVYNAPVANVTIVDTAVCEGAEVTVTAHLNQNVPEQINLEYQWYTKTANDTDYVLVPGATELTYTTTIFETTTFKFDVVHTLSGCFDVDSATIQVFPIPVITEVVMSDTNVCEGSDMIITAIIDSTKGIAGYPYYYEWRRNGELLEGNTATIHDQPMTADGTTQTYVYSAIAYQTPERLACYSQLVNSAELTVFGDPRVAIFGDQHVCYTDTISLIANVDTFAYPVGDLHFQWYESGNMITNLNGDSAVLSYYAPAQDEPYRFTVQIERDNAQAACRMYSTEYDVWVYNAPVANVTIVDTAVCEGAEVTVTAHLNQNVPEQLNLEYQWYTKTASDTDYVLVPGATELTYTTTIFETTEFQFGVVHTLSGCHDEDSKTIQVFPIPVITEVVMSDTNVCEGSDMIITAIIDSTKGIAGYPYYYEWRRNGELLEGNTATIHDQPMTVDGTTQTYVYSAIAYQTPERMACYSQLVNSAELTVFGNPRVAIFGDQHVCYTDTISLIANVDTFAYPVGDLHYIWYESGNMITNLNGDNAVLSYYAPAQDEPYRFTVQIERDNSEAACRSYSTEYDVWVYNAPVANVTIVDETVCEGAEVTVTAHLNQNDPEQLNLEYQWYTKTSSDTDYVLVPGATALTYTTIVNDTTEFMFRVVHTLSGCFDTDSKTINVNPIPVVNYVSMSDTNVCEGAQVTIYADVDTTKGVPGMPYFFEWRRNGELLAGNTQTIFDSPMTVDGNEQTFVYSVIAYQDPTRLACFSQLVESATLNVFPNPRVAISGDQYVCETDSVFLYANVDTIGRPVGLLHYTWYESGRLRDNMAYGLGDSRYFSEYFYAQDEPYRFTVQVERDDIAGGCRAYSEEFLVWVYPQPVVNITADETEICRGGEIVLRANLNNYEFNYANDSQYQWYTVDTVKDVRHIGIDSATGDYIDSTIITVEHNPIPGATMLIYRTTLDSSAVFGFTATHNLSGCSDYDEIAITVNDIPVIVSVENLSGQDTLCPGGRVELHATVEGGVPGGEIYTWYRNGVEMESTGENLIDYPLAVDNDVTMYIYEVVVKQTAAGCESVIDSLSTDTIWVVPNPTIELSGDPIVCDTTDLNIVITANVVSYVDTTDYEYTYQWYENNAPIDGETGLVLSIHKPYRDYPYSFNFAVMNPYGCTVNSEPFLVYVNDNPIVHIAADDTMICENGTVTLTADLYDQNAENLVYVWYINGDSIPGAYNTTYTTTLTSTSTFTFKAYQRDSHCAAISNEVTVNVVPAPVVDSITVVSVDTAICEGHVVTLHANISGGDTTDTPVFTWYKDNEVVEGVTGETFTDYPMSVDNEITTHVYNVTVAQASSACFSLYDVNDEVTINVRPNPRYTIYGDADVCETETGNNITLYGITNDSIIATAADYTYTWYESGVVIDGQTTATLNINKPYRTEPYIFKLVVTDNQFGCTAETEDFLVYVSARPIVNVTSTEDTICTNGVVTLTANIYDQNAEYLAFQWYKNDTTAANMIAGANDPTYTTAVETTTEFIVVVDQLTTGCQTVASTTVKVNEIPVITSVENLSGQDTLCPGGRVELHATISGGVAGGEVYTWYRNGVQLESTGENLIDYPMAEDNNVAQYIYEVTVRQTAAACQSVITAASTDTLWIVPNPTIELAGDPIVCDTTANNIVITANVVSYLETPYTYQWYENNAPINGETGLTLSIHKDYRDYPYSFNFAVQNIYGCTVESEPFLVYVNDNPIVGITVDDTMICTNGTVTLTADLYDQNADNMVYQWYKDNVAIDGAYDLTYTTTLDQTATFKFYAYQRDSHCAAYSNEITVNVVAAPVVDSISVVSDDVTICEGHVVSLHANVTGGDNVDSYVYTWYKDNEIVEGATGADYTDYPMSVDNEITAHVYNVTVAQASSACFSEYLTSTEVNVTVRPNPRYTIYGDADVCEAETGNNITLYGITNDAVIAGDYTYTWYESGVEIAGQTTDTLSINLDARTEPYIFKLVVTDNEFGCTAETADFYVTVAAKPIVTVTSTEDTICTDGVVTLTANIYDQNADNLAFQWAAGGVNIAGANDQTYTVAVNTTTDYSVTVTQLTTGCETVATKTITVNEIPVVTSIDLLSVHDTVCDGGRVELQANISGGVAGGEVYTWYRNGVELESTGNTVVDYPRTVDNNYATYVYEVVVRQNAAACQSVITAASTHTILVAPNPTIELAGDAIVCEATGNNVEINANVVYYVDTTNFGFTYQWYENNVAIDGETGLTLSINKPYRDYPYSFNFAVQNAYGCTVESEPFLVYVNDAPVVSIAADDTMICENGTVTLTANLYDQNADNMVFVWYKNNDSIPGAYNTTYTTTLDATATFSFKAFQRNSHCVAVSNDVTVTVVPVPVVDSISVVSEDVTICEGHVVSLHANVTGGDATDEYVYTWYKDNEIVEGATGADYTDYPMSVDNDITVHTYNVTVAQTSSACFSLYDNNTEVEVSVRPNPRYTIYGDADVCEMDSTENNINLVGITNDNVIGATTDYTFTWYESGVEIAGQNTANLSINLPYRDYAYRFKLVVTDNVYGCTAETAEFDVTVAQRPVVVIVADQDSICEGGNVTLTSTLMNQSEEGIVYQWQNDVNGTWTNIEGAIAPIYVTPALTETTVYRLHITNTINGCENNSNEVTVTVKPTPVIDILNVTADVVCNGGEVTLTATGADQYTGMGEVHYQWYNNGQAIFGADQNVYTTSPLTVAGDMTTYTFGVQVTMSNSGCVSNVDTATVTVYADPTVTITYNNGLTLCEGGVTTLTANPNHAYFTDFTYQWFLHGQPIPGANDSTYVVENLAASANAYDYTVEITVNNGTQNGCSAMAEPVYVTIVNDPTANITVNEGVNAICEGGTVTFTVNVNDGVADTYNPYTYAWYNNIAGNGVVLGTEASYTTSADDAANLYVYTVEVTSAYGCNVLVSDTLRIVEDPTVTIAVKAGEDTVVCDGGHTTLIATVEGGLGTASYQWFKNGFAIAGATGNELVTDALYANETSAYTVMVSQTGIACTATSTQFNVAVYEGIEVALDANSEVNCVGGSVTLTATTTNGIPGDVLTYQWFRNGNPINGANGAQYTTDENLVAGHYEYQVEVSSNISGCHVAQSGTIGITVEAEPTVMISSDVEGNAICEGGDITLTANVIYATNATQHNNTYTYTWKWYEGTTLRSVQTSEPHYTLSTNMAAGSYNFFVEISSNDGLGCDASSQANLFNVVIKPVPTVILTATADESCQGGDVTFNAVVIPSNLSGIFYWNVNGQQIVSNNASITVNNMAIGTNNISVVFAPNDAQVACQSATTTITHTVNAVPVVTLNATDPSRLSMCVGGTITIAATATGTASNSDHYVWTVDGQTQYGNTGSTFTTQLNTPGIHTFSAMVERAMGCNSLFSTPIAVTVAEQPVAQLTQTAGFAEMCAGGEITLMAKVSNYATVNNGVTNNSVHNTYTYTWYRDNAEFMTTPNVTVDNAQITETLNTPASYTYSVTITASGYNCQAAHATLDHQIKVVPDPSWSVNQVNPTELCIGGIVTLNAEVTGGVENQQAGRIQWYKTFNGVESEVPGLGGVNTDVPQAAGVYTYAPKYIDYIGAGCNIADATATQVTVNDLPTAVFSSGHGSVICGHDYQSFATLTITLTGTAPFTFTIMNMTTGESQTIVTSLSVYTLNVNPSMTSIYRILSVSDANGCEGTMDNVADVVVNVSDVQIAAETVVASCGDYVARIPLQVNASTSTTFTATLPDGSTQTGNIMFDTYTQQHYVEVQMPAVAGDYMVNIEVDGCSGDVLVRVPADDITMGVSTTLVDQRWEDVVVVNNNPDNNGGFKFNTFQWYKNDEIIEGATDQYYQEVGGLEGFYSVELDGIRVSDGAHVHFITCGKYFSGNASIRVYPVPANTTQEVTIELNMTEEELEGAILDIYDVRGAHVKSLSNLTPITKVGNFGAQGTYFGRIITGTNEIKTVKFIIVK